MKSRGSFLLLLLWIAGSGYLPAGDGSGIVDPRRELDLRGRVDREAFHVTDDGRIWIVTGIGSTYRTDSLLGDWTVASLEATGGLLSDHFSQVRFFDGTHGLITGYIRAGFGEQTAAYRTSDGGETWQVTRFAPVDGPSEWIYDLCTLPTGEAWMGGSEGSLLQSDDFGATWKALTPPFDSKTRTYAIFMDGTGIGYVGALHDDLRRTVDGGRTWKRLKTPFSQHAYPRRKENRGDDHRIEDIGRFADRLFVEQDGRVFTSPPERIRWEAFPEPGLVAFEIRGSTMAGMRPDGQVVLVEAGLSTTPVAAEGLEGALVDLEIASGAVYALDGNHRVYEFRDGKRTMSYPLTSTGPFREIHSARRWGGATWGITLFGVYESRDGDSWTRRAESPVGLQHLEVLSEDRLMLWDGHGTNLVFRRATGALEVIQDLEGYDVVRVIRGEKDRWIAYGGMQYETMRRVEVSRTYFSGQFRGSRDHGFVFLSEDQGASWRQIDRWSDGGVAAVFAGWDGTLYLLSYLGAVRRLDPASEGYEATDLVQVRKETWDLVPYVEVPRVLYFEDDETGYIAGWIHQLGERYFRTDDGGRIWRSIEEEEFPFRGLIRHPAGEVVYTGSELFLLRGRHRSLIADLSARIDESEWIEEVSVDDQGNLFVAVERYDRDEEQMRHTRFLIPGPKEPSP